MRVLQTYGHGSLSGLASLSALAGLVRLSAVAGVSVLALSGTAAAQMPAEPPVIQPLPPAQPEPAPLPPAPPPELAPPEFAPQDPAPVAPLQRDPLQGEFPPPPPVAPPPLEEPKPAGGEGLRFSAFVDAHYGFQTQAKDTAVPAHRAYEFNNFITGQEVPSGYAQNGFSLSFAGIDATYDAGQLGATISLRAGPSVPIFYAGDTGPLGIDNLTQAYASWNPTSQLSIDFGQFSTIFGAEVAESWQNLNYTRGGLYYAMQPFWHTGVRATLSPNDQLAVTGMVVNGTNLARDDNESPSLALQLSITPNDAFSLAAGWLTNLKPSTDGGSFDNFFDLVAAVTVDRFSLVFNADLTVNSDKFNRGTGFTQDIQDPMFWGLSLAAGYQATDLFGLAIRGEYLSDHDNQLYKVQRTLSGVTFPSTEETNVATVTGTLDFKPVEGSNNLVIRWDNRIEASNEELFFNRSSEATKVWFGSVLGVVVTTDG